MASTPSPSAASQYAPANATINNAYGNAGGMATPPATYTPNANQENDLAKMFSQAYTQQNQAALQQRSPQAFAGQEAAINTLTGGVPGDNAFLSNASLKAGLEGAASQGTGGAGSIISPSSAGGVTAEKIFGSNLLNYRNQQAQQALGVARSIQPDAAVSPGALVSQNQAANQQFVTNQNDYNNYLNNLRLGQVQNLQDQTQQAEGATQGVYNANSGAANANRSQLIGVGSSLLAAGAGAAVIL